MWAIVLLCCPTVAAVPPPSTGVTSCIDPHPHLIVVCCPTLLGECSVSYALKCCGTHACGYGRRGINAVTFTALLVCCRTQRKGRSLVMPTADEHVLNIVASLEGAASVIEAELEVINVDLQNAEDNCRRYGEVFLAPCRYLVQLRENKKLRYREIIGELEALRVQLEASNNLLRVLGQGPSASVTAASALYPSSTSVHRTVRR